MATLAVVEYVYVCLKQCRAANKLYRENKCNIIITENITNVAQREKIVILHTFHSNMECLDTGQRHGQYEMIDDTTI